MLGPVFVWAFLGGGNSEPYYGTAILGALGALEVRFNF